MTFVNMSVSLVWHILMFKAKKCELHYITLHNMWLVDYTQCKSPGLQIPKAHILTPRTVAVFLGHIKEAMTIVITVDSINVM